MPSKAECIEALSNAMDACDKDELDPILNPVLNFADDVCYGKEDPKASHQSPESMLRLNAAPPEPVDPFPDMWIMVLTFQIVKLQRVQQ